jgi:1,4-dihydroxy-2-naphthoyl-CoA hydrolase
LLFRLRPCRMTLEDIKSWTSSRPTLADSLGMEIVGVTDEYLEGRMPVDGRTHQPMGLLHGGASVALAETLGSIAAALRVDRTKQACVGLEINANHLKGVRDGWVRGRATPVHIGRSTQVWEICITHEETGALVCISRITMAVIDLPAAGPTRP